MQLGFTASPKMRRYVGHELDPQYRYYRAAAAKAENLHRDDADLSALYREIVRVEDADAARRKHQAELEAAEW